MVIWWNLGSVDNQLHLFSALRISAPFGQAIPRQRLVKLRSMTQLKSPEMLLIFFSLLFQVVTDEEEEEEESSQGVSVYLWILEKGFKKGFMPSPIIISGSAVCKATFLYFVSQ